MVAEKKKKWIEDKLLKIEIKSGRRIEKEKKEKTEKKKKKITLMQSELRKTRTVAKPSISNLNLQCSQLLWQLRLSQSILCIEHSDQVNKCYRRDVAKNEYLN